MRGYIDLALRGGFPEPVLHLTGAARQAWLDTYVDQLVTRDAEALDGVRDPVLLRRYFEALCVNTAGIVETREERLTGVERAAISDHVFVRRAKNARDCRESRLRALQKALPDVQRQVGEGGCEPPASCSQSRRAAWLR